MNAAKMASSKIESIRKVYRAISQNPSLTNAKLLQVTDNELTIQSSWSQKILEEASTKKYSINWSLKKGRDAVVQGYPNNTTSELISEITENLKRTAILTSEPSKDKDTSTKQFIEIYEDNYLIKNYNLSALDVHGDVYADGQFGSFKWSPDNTKLLYIAEKKKEKSEPFFKQKPLDNKNENKEEPSKGNEYIFKEDWGEQLVGKHRPVVVVLDTTTDTLTVMSGIADDLSPGQVIWTPEGDAIIGVAWKHEPRYLGLIACTNRASWIFSLKNGEYKKISTDECAVRSPRFSPDGKHLIWLEREAGGPHNNASKLMHLNWKGESTTSTVLIDTVKTNIKINNGKLFYGFYAQNLPNNCWSSDSKYIFFSTQQRANIKSYYFDIESHVLTEIVNDTSSLTIVDIKSNAILFKRTSLIEPSRLLLGYFVPGTDKIPFISISRELKLPQFEDIIYETNEYVYDNNEPVKEFNYMYFGPKNGKDKSLPLVVAIHGGPHGSYANMFFLDPAVLVSLGFAVIQINYRGSIGMGSDNVEYLQGKVGHTDVIDCYNAIADSFKKYPWIDDKRVGISGGSHGGFLVTHLSGQYPDAFKAVVARNPVIDIAAMFTISDIPDCIVYFIRCAAVIGEHYDDIYPGENAEKAGEMVMKMYKSSPIVHVRKVKAPTLMCIGKNDLRVPCSQGKHWYQRLKANGVKTKMLVYDDCHPLASGPAEIDQIINSALWMIDHVKNIE
ncbi:acylamino-acid-releasing enzyme-like isoform X1 [Aphidius gifuensis]|uniref:acylamino-acid-releasing enzyme-like isoform X1 n=1 Tax=Aphidius gifuensis TaxID=684658 RepID=UPI001CDCF135|nr:acylamino-acid-releasing enzyme-like isoform X1 [Aphidius gifuensis]